MRPTPKRRNRRASSSPSPASKKASSAPPVSDTPPKGILAEVLCEVSPRMRVEVPVNDGNGIDQPGTVIAALPECCVVQLDSRMKYAGIYTAADWDLVKVLNLSPARKGARHGGK